jgi:hypothetical protein
LGVGLDLAPVGCDPLVVREDDERSQEWPHRFSLMFNLALPAERALSRLDGVSAGHGTATA